MSYQLLQSLYGMGNGGWFGVGLGQSRAKWSYLPNADSDFIFAIIGEELGLIGAGILLLLFALLAYTGLRIARRNVDPFVKIVASAATVWLVGQAAINIGYVVGLLPGHRHPAADDLRRRHLAADHDGGLRAAGELRPAGTAGRGGAGRGRRQPAGQIPRDPTFGRLRGQDPRAVGVEAEDRPPSRAVGAAAAGTPARSSAQRPRPGPVSAGPGRRSRSSGPTGSGTTRRAPQARASRIHAVPIPRSADPRRSDQRGANPRGRGPRTGDPRSADHRGGRQSTAQQPCGGSAPQRDARGAEPRVADPRGVDPRRASQRGADPGVGRAGGAASDAVSCSPAAAPPGTSSRPSRSPMRCSPSTRASASPRSAPNADWRPPWSRPAATSCG